MAAPAFSDFLRYITLDGDDIVRLHPDGFLAGFRFRGPDPYCTNDFDVDGFDRAIATVLAYRGTEWCYHITVQRGRNAGYPKSGYWPSSTVYALDYVRGERYEREGEHLPTEHRLWVSYFPRAGKGRLLKELTGRADMAVRDPRRHFLEQLGLIEAQLRTKAQDVRRLGLRHAHLGDREIVTSSLVNALYAEITDRHRLFAVDPNEPIFLGNVLSPSETELQPSLRIDGRNVLVASVWGWPSAARSAMLAPFSLLPFHVKLSTRIIPYKISEADGALARRSRTFLLASLGPGLLFNRAGDEEDKTPVHYRATLKEAQERNKQGVPYCSALSTVVIYARDDEEYRRATNALHVTAEATGCQIAIESGPQRFNAFLASLPGEIDRNPIRVSTMSLAAAAKAAPLTSVWHGPETHPNRRYKAYSEPILMMSTPTREPFRLYLHEREVGHTLIIAPTGSGKSTLLRCLENGHLSRYPNATAINLDIGWSSYKYARAIRGQHLVAQLDQGPQFSPIADLADPTQFPDVLDWVRDLTEIWMDRSITLAEYDAIRKGLEAMRDLSPEVHRLSTLGRVVPDTQLRAFFDTFRDSFLDSPGDSLDFGKAAVRYWSIEYGMLGLDNPRWVSPFISYVQRKAFASFSRQTNSPRLFAIDEGARALKSRRIADMSERFEREGRRNLVSFLFATQSAVEVANSSIAQVLIEQTATRICSANPRVREAKTADTYRAIGFNDEQLRLIAELSDYDMLVTNGNGTQVVSLKPTSLELAICSGASEEDRSIVNDMIDRHGASWLPQYLRRRIDLPDLQEYVQAIEALDDLSNTTRFVRKEIA